MLGIHLGRFPRTEPEKGSIESLPIGEYAARFHIIGRRDDVRSYALCDEFIVRKDTQTLDAITEHSPECIQVIRTRKPPVHTNNGNLVHSHFEKTR